MQALYSQIHAHPLSESAAWILAGSSVGLAAVIMLGFGMATRLVVAPWTGFTDFGAGQNMA
jgi:hypothetical protein